MNICLKCLVLSGLATLFSLAHAETGNTGNRVPILLLATDKNFGSYTSEILRAEGFNEFDTDSVSCMHFSAAFLRKFDIVILAEASISAIQQQILVAYVKQGGNLVAFKPDRKLSDVFGITGERTTLSEGYLLLQSDAEIGRGISRETMQFHGLADNYKIQAGKVIATLYADPSKATEHPAIVMNEFGKGHAIAFLYNLPESIVLTRQGNFRHAGIEKDGITGIRAMDLFTDGWVNSSRNIINQADEQMRILSHCIENLSAYSKPLPRLWYFPDTLQCLATLNNDGEDSEEAEFTPQFEDVDAKGAKMTLYIKETDKVSAAWVHKWMSKGFEIGGHPDDTRQAVRPDWNTMDSVIKELKSRLKRKYGIADMHTNTNHWFVWCGNNADGSADFSALARIEEQNHIGLDCNYAHYDNNSTQGHFLGEMGVNQGNYTGSGLPMKFSDINGKLINVYQQLNNVYDQQYMEHKDQEGYYNAFKGLMDRSLENEVYSFISVKAHNNEYFFSKIPLMKMLDYANSRQVPVWSEVKLLDFLKARNEVSFSDTRWENNKLEFTIHSSLKHTNGVTFMVPASYRNKKITAIAVNGRAQNYSVRAVKGFEYAMITFKPGTDYRYIISYKK